MLEPLEHLVGGAPGLGHGGVAGALLGGGALVGFAELGVVLVALGGGEAGGLGEVVVALDALLELAGVFEDYVPGFCFGVEAGDVGDDGGLAGRPAAGGADFVEALDVVLVLLPLFGVGEEHAEAGIGGDFEGFGGDPGDAHGVEQGLRIAGAGADGGFGDGVEVALVGEELLGEGLADDVEGLHEAVAGFGHG